MHRLPLAFGTLALVGCSAPAPSQPPRNTADEPEVLVLDAPAPTVSSSPGEAKTEAPKTIAPGEVVPAFRITTVDGETIDSAEVVGKKPFVVLFFASWCGVCEEKLPLVQAALAEEGPDLLVLGAALDEPETWARVAPYVERHALSVTLVRGQAHRDFAGAYDPFGTVPVVMVIDEEGRIVDLQRGMRPGDGDRLLEALRQVRKDPLGGGG